MYCIECGCKLSEDDVFCPNCGNKVEIKPDIQEEIDDSEKKGWKDYFTPNNIERFAPVSALFPVAMWLVVNVIIGKILFGLLRLLGLNRINFLLYRPVSFVASWIFILLAIAATGSLIYVTLKEKDTSKVTSWYAPLITGIASIACLGMFFHWKISGLLVVISLVLGVELLYRVVISGAPIDSTPQFAGLITAIKSSIEEYNRNRQIEKSNDSNKSNEINGSGSIDLSDSYFDGSGAELLGLSIICILVSIITCGIATPWMLCKLYRWKISHTVINGKRLQFDGTGAELLGKWIIMEILTIITCGIYGLFVYINIRKWELKHTFIVGDNLEYVGDASLFDGGVAEYIGYSILTFIITFISCGIASPWAITMLQKWDTSHQVINGKRLEYNGTGAGLFGEYIIVWILSLITCGIYSCWGVVRVNKYITKNTRFIN